LYAQTTKASVSGVVSDSSGAVVGGAKVSVRDLDRGLTFSNMSNAAGFYLLPEPPPGNYALTAEATGFRTYALDRLPQQPQQKASVDVAMQVGAMAERVEVMVSAQMLDTNTAAISSVIENVPRATAKISLRSPVLAPVVLLYIRELLHDLV
jgi:hypothetical protein